MANRLSWVSYVFFFRKIRDFPEWFPSFFFFFFLFPFLLWPHLWHMQITQTWGQTGTAAAGPCHSHHNAESKPHLAWIYTTACSNAGSLAHWVRPGIEPKSSWAFCWVLNPLSHSGNSPNYFLRNHFLFWGKWKTCTEIYIYIYISFCRLVGLLIAFFSPSCGRLLTVFLISMAVWKKKNLEKFWNLTSQGPHRLDACHGWPKLKYTDFY